MWFSLKELTLGVQIDKKDIIANLPKKGFKKVENGDHIYFTLEIDGIDKGIYTYVSHGTIKTYSGQLLGALKNQLKLNSSMQVKELCECPMTQEKYLELLRSKNIIN